MHLAPILAATRMAVSIITSLLSLLVRAWPVNKAHQVFDFGALVALLVRPHQMADGEDQQTETGTAPATLLTS